MNEKLKSRKLWVVVASAAITAFSGQLGIDSELIKYILMLTSSYVLGQGAVDAIEATKTNPSADL